MVDKRRAHFIEPWFVADLHRVGMKEARAVGEESRDEFEREGLDPTQLHRCRDDGPGGSRLGDCLKLYLPGAGHLRMIFRPIVLPSGEEVYLHLAFGRAHPLAGEGQDVYVVAHQRRHKRR